MWRSRDPLVGRFRANAVNAVGPASWATTSLVTSLMTHLVGSITALVAAVAAATPERVQQAV